MTNEQWRDVPGWEGKYEVSDCGRIKSHVGRTPGRMRKPVITKLGYAQVQFRAGDRVETLLIHVLVDRAFRGPMPDGLEVNHEDGDKQNNRLTNLERMTRSQNVKHSFRTGLRTHKGEDHPGAILNDLTVRAIRAEAGPRTVSGRLRRGAVAELAAKYRVSRPTINGILSGRSWAHVK